MKIEPQALIAKTREVVESRPKVRYEHDICEYAEGECSDGSIGCIFGQVFRDLGVKSTTLSRFDSHKDICGLTIVGIIDEFPELFYIERLSIQDREWLGCVQEMQDNGATWGEAIRAADKELL